MDTSSAAGYVDFSRYARLREDARADSRAALAKVADEFEALMVELMLKSARDAGGGDELFDSSASRTYREMLDQQLARNLATSGDFGIGAALERQLGALLGEAGAASAPGDDAPETGMGVALRRYTGPERGSDEREPGHVASLAAHHGTGDRPVRGQGGARGRFVAEHARHAEAAAAELGVSPRAILAQAGLESGWGQHVIRHRDGTSSHNYFGIKAGPGWRGATVSVPTTEYVGGRAVTVQARFRAYPSAAAAFRDYVQFIGANPRYADALARGESAAGYARGLAAAGYATDPRYAEKIIAIIETGDWADLPRATPARGHGG